jgi:charged multivesicular body protein 5
MNRLFGKGKEPEPPKPEPKKEEPRAEPGAAKVPSLKEQSQKMQVRINELEATIREVNDELKACFEKAKAAKGSAKEMYKAKCVQLVKKKKVYENQVKTLLGGQMMLDQAAFTTENIQQTIETTQAMKETVKAQKEQMKSIDLDEVFDVREKMEEMRMENEYLNEQMQYDYDVDLDEAELDSEISEMREEVYEEDRRGKDVLRNKR